jgi:dimethylamine/trimethylamine dehydrogenase
MVDKVHEHGALAGVQLGFNGSGSENLDTRICPRGVEQCPSDTFVFHSCYTMTKREIRELEQFYVQAALRAKRVGFDVINFCVNEDCTVIQQFLMPRYNHRTDEYGDLENRSRFMREVLGDREAVAECAVTCAFDRDA